MNLLPPLLTPRHQLTLALHESQTKPEVYDLAVVGGGATGLGVALDAAEQSRMNDALRALQNAGRLLEVGEVTSAEVLRAYREADIFALPSYREGLPNVLLEAMAASRPCMATPVGGIPDILTGAGELLPVGDVAAWTAGIDALARDEKRRAELGERGRARVVQSCGTDQVMAGYRAVYQQSLR